MSQLTLHNVCKSFGKTEVLNNINLTIRDGEFVVFVGPSGCGKSTLLRMICGLEAITEGELMMDGDVVNNWSPKDRGIGMVFQSYALYPHMNVFENMAFGLQVQGLNKKEIEERIKNTAEMLQLTPLLERKPKALSGGQRQRVAIGRAMVREPRVFLLDEPLSNLDAALRVHMRMELAELHREQAATMVYVTHDQTEAMTLADKIVVLNQGRIEQVGTPLALYNTPANQFVAGFIGSPKMNFIDCHSVAEQLQFPAYLEVAKLKGELQETSVSKTLMPEAPVTLGIRPEHLNVMEEAGENTLAATVKYHEQLGSETLIYVTLANGDIVSVKLDGQHQYVSGDTLWLGFPVEHIHLFDLDTLRVNDDTKMLNVA